MIRLWHLQFYSCHTNIANIYTNITIYSFTSKQTTKILNATWYVWLIHDTSLKLLLKYSVVKDFSWRRMLLKFPIQCVWFWRKWHIFYETYTLFRPLSNYGNSIITDYTVFHILKPSKCNNYPIFLAEIISQIDILAKH